MVGGCSPADIYHYVRGGPVRSWTIIGPDNIIFKIVENVVKVTRKD